MPYNGLTKRDTEFPNIYLRNNATDVIYHLIFNPNTETTGAIAMAPVGKMSGNNTTTLYEKR